MTDYGCCAVRLEKNFDRTGYSIDCFITETVGTQRTQDTSHWSVRERSSYRKAGAPLLERNQRNENEHYQRYSIIGFQSRFEGGELGCQMDRLRDKIESGDRALECAHASVERGTTAAAG
jgi:hypothetical protein